MIAALFALTALATSAHAQDTAQADFRGPAYRLHAELHNSRARKTPDLWIEFEDRDAHGLPRKFRATSLSTRFREAEWRLNAAPVSKLEGETIFIYYGFNLATGEYDGNHSLALIFHIPAAQFTDATIEHFTKYFPGSVSRDGAGKPRYIKAVLCRITESQVYPVAAFDAEPPQASPN